MNNLRLKDRNGSYLLRDDFVIARPFSNGKICNVRVTPMINYVELGLSEDFDLSCYGGKKDSPAKMISYIVKIKERRACMNIRFLTLIKDLSGSRSTKDAGLFEMSRCSYFTEQGKYKDHKPLQDVAISLARYSGSRSVPSNYFNTTSVLGFFYPSEMHFLETLFNSYCIIYQDGWKTVPHLQYFPDRNHIYKIGSAEVCEEFISVSKKELDIEHDKRLSDQGLLCEIEEHRKAANNPWYFLSDEEANDAYWNTD